MMMVLTCRCAPFCICGFSCHKGRCMDPLGRKCSRTEPCPYGYNCRRGRCMDPACSRKEPCPCGYYCGKRGICTTIGQKNTTIELSFGERMGAIFKPLGIPSARPPSRPNLVTAVGGDAFSIPYGTKWTTTRTFSLYQQGKPYFRNDERTTTT